MRDGFTLKQRKFIDAYVGPANGNATEAARQAGYAKPMEQGYENLRKPQISAEIERLYRSKCPPAEEVLGRLGDQARGIGQYVRFHRTPLGKFETFLDMEALLADGKGHLIKSVKRTDKGDENIEVYDAQTALLNLGRHYKLFTDKTELGVSVSFEDDLNNLTKDEIRQRLAAAVAGLADGGVPEEP